MTAGRKKAAAAGKAFAGSVAKAVLAISVIESTSCSYLKHHLLTRPLSSCRTYYFG